MYFFTGILSITFLATAISSCCGEGYDCPPADVSAMPWEKYVIGDTVTYYTTNASDIKFILDTKEKTNRYTGDCVFYSGSGCNCDMCSSWSKIAGTNVDSNSTINKFSISGDGEGFDSDGNTHSIIVFYMERCSGSILLNYKTQQHSSIFIKDYSFNNIKYDSVAIAEYDTLQPYYPNTRVWRVYYHISKGIIGFESRLPNKTYYLKE